MRKKERKDWYNYEVLHEKRLGKITCSVSLNAEVARTFLKYLQDRVDRDTGIRFSFDAPGARELILAGDKQELTFQAFSEDPNVYPNVDGRTGVDRFDSPYNRVEIYIPIEEVPTKHRRWE